MISARGSWRPVLSGRLREQSLAAARDVARLLASSHREHPLEPNTLAHLAMLRAYLDPNGEPDPEIAQLLGEAVTAAADARLPAWLWGGYVGFAWALQHTATLAGVGDDELVASADQLLDDQLAGCSGAVSYDLISGLAGFGVYLLDRPRSPVARRALERVFTLLDRSKLTAGSGITWLKSAELTEDKKTYPNGCFDLGLAHGVPGIVGLLALAHRAGVATERERRLLEGAVRWVFEQREAPSPSRPGCPVFPGSFFEGLRVKARLGWCYGDAAVSAVLLLAARAAGRSDWEADALEVARIAAGVPLERSGVRDAGLCHGSTGQGLLFARLYHATGEPLFRDTAERWYRHALSLRSPAATFGFRKWSWVDQQWRDDPSMLQGASGVALGLLAGATEVEPTWDRLLLASLPIRTTDRHRG